MNNISRRQFIGKSAMGIGTAVLASRLPLDLHAAVISGAVKMPLGFQVWTIREKLVQDFAGTLKMMAGLGYQSVEMCSPPGYADSGFEPLMKIKAKEMLQIINDAGLIFESTHYGMDELRNNLDARMEFALESGQKQMIVSSFGLQGKPSLKKWLEAANELNEMGSKTKHNGIQLGYHNHHMEFDLVDGTPIYDSLMKEFDPELVRMQFQVAVISIGYKASDYFIKYPGRFISAHLADWSTQEKKNVALGQGIVDWKEFFIAADKGGVKNIFVEMDPETFKDSATYIHGL